MVSRSSYFRGVHFLVVSKSVDEMGLSIVIQSTAVHILVMVLVSSVDGMRLALALAKALCIVLISLDDIYRLDV